MEDNKNLNIEPYLQVITEKDENTTPTIMSSQPKRPKAQQESLNPENYISEKQEDQNYNTNLINELESPIFFTDNPDTRFKTDLNKQNPQERFTQYNSNQPAFSRFSEWTNHDHEDAEMLKIQTISRSQLGGLSCFLAGSYYQLQILAAGQLYDPDKYISGIATAVLFMSFYTKLPFGLTQSLAIQTGRCTSRKKMITWNLIFKTHMKLIYILMAFYFLYQGISVIVICNLYSDKPNLREYCLIFQCMSIPACLMSFFIETYRALFVASGLGKICLAIEAISFCVCLLAVWFGAFVLNFGFYGIKVSNTIVHVCSLSCYVFLYKKLKNFEDFRNPPDIEESELAITNNNFNTPVTSRRISHGEVQQFNYPDNGNTVSTTTLMTLRGFLMFSLPFIILKTVRTLWFECDNLQHSVFWSVSFMAEESCIMAIWIGVSSFLYGYGVSISAEISKSICLMDIQAAKIRGFWGQATITALTSFIGFILQIFSDNLSKGLLNQSIVTKVVVIENDSQLSLLIKIFACTIPLLGIESFFHALLMAIGKQKILIITDFFCFYQFHGCVIWKSLASFGQKLEGFWYSVAISTILAIIIKVIILNNLDWNKEMNKISKQMNFAT